MTSAHGESDAAAAMNCPRCATPMRDAKLDNSVLKTCPHCEGTWFPGEALGDVTDHTLSEVRQSELEPTLVGDRLESIDLEKPIDCPVCHVPMMRYRYTMTCDVVLDECLEHGVWLDDGELGSLLSFLHELYSGVEARKNELGAINKNLEYLEGLSRDPESQRLPSDVLETLHQVHQRPR